MNRTLKFPRTEENYVIVLSKVKNGMLNMFSIGLLQIRNILFL